LILPLAAKTAKLEGVMAGCPNLRTACPGRALAGRKLASGFFGRCRRTCVRRTPRKSLNSRRVARPAATKTASGVRYYGLRYYCPSTGRWLNRDPLEENGGINLYAHTANDPVNTYDLRGEASRTDDISSLRQTATDWRAEGYTFAANLLTVFFTGKGFYVASQNEVDSIKNSSEYRSAAQEYFGALAKAMCSDNKSGQNIAISDGRYQGPYAFDVEYHLGGNSALFYALGGAHFYYVGTMNLCCSSNCTWSVDVTMAQNDFYTFRPTSHGVRLLFPSYRAGHELEMTYGAKPFWHTETWKDTFSSK
jgi:RHS repeat-associated protein